MGEHDKNLKAIAFRLPPQYKEKLVSLSRQTGITQTLVLELLLGYTNVFEIKKLLDKHTSSQK